MGLLLIISFISIYGIYELYDFLSDDDDTDENETLETARADDIQGTDASEEIRASEGDNAIDARSGDDTVFAGAGNDIVDAGEGNDRVLGLQGNDVILGNAGNDSLLGNLGIDVLAGNEGNDTLLGNQDNDVIIGGDGADSLVGGIGDDILIGRFLATEQNNTPNVAGAPGLDFDPEEDDISEFIGNLETDRIDLSTLVTFVERDDDITAETPGADTLEGGPGNDRLFVGAEDIATGGTGRDEFVVSDVNPGPVAVITDYSSAEDFIVVQITDAQLPQGSITVQDQGNDAIISVDGTDVVQVLNAAGTLSTTQLQIARL